MCCPRSNSEYVLIDHCNASTSPVFPRYRYLFETWWTKLHWCHLIFLSNPCFSQDTQGEIILNEVRSKISCFVNKTAHVSWPVVNARRHMKNDFSQQKNISKCMTFAVQLTGQCQAVCTTITHHNRVGGLCPVNNGGQCSQYSHNPLHSQGEHEDEEEPNSQKGSSQIIPRWPGNLAREVIPGPTQQYADNCTANLVIVPGELNYNSARGTEHCKCQGHLTLNSARGTEHLRCHGHIGQLC